MRIDKLTATFGKLQSESLALHEGLNILYAPNESGKSTWCAFIRAMLYGVDSAERARAGYLPDKQRYAPWSGAAMQGSMELTVNGRSITLERTTKTPNAPMREFSAVYTGTNVSVDGLNGRNAGEKLTGVSRDVFRRSAFVEQGAVSVSGSVELERRISSIVSTGEEQSSYTEADSRLREWQRKRRYNRRGLLPELESEMDEARLRLRGMDAAIAEVRELEAQLEEKTRECEELEVRVISGKKQQRKDALSRIGTKRRELERCEAEHESAKNALSAAESERSSSFFGSVTPEEAENIVRKDLSELKALRQTAKAPTFLLPVILFALTAAALVLCVLKPTVLLASVAVLLAAAAAMVLGQTVKNRRAAAEALERQKMILDKYGVSAPNGIRPMLERHGALCAACADAAEEEQICRENVVHVRAELKALEDLTLRDLDFVGGDSDAARLNRELNAARQEQRRLAEQLAAAEGRLSVSGDPLVIASELGCMEAEYEDLRREYEAIGLAAEVLKDADAELSSRFSPALGRLAAEYMSEMTGGRYEDVLLDRDLSARTRTSGDSVARPSEYLSAGTVDLMYLSVRLAVCELALPEGEPCPLIIDDALVNLDGQRYNAAMKLLEKIAKKRQVILFTCRS